MTAAGQHALVIGEYPYNTWSILAGPTLSARFGRLPAMAGPHLNAAYYAAPVEEFLSAA